MGLVFDTVLFVECFAIIQEAACTTAFINCWGSTDELSTLNLLISSCYCAVMAFLTLFFILALLIWKVVLYSPLLDVFTKAFVVTLTTYVLLDDALMSDTHCPQNSVKFISWEPVINNSWSKAEKYGSQDSVSKLAFEGLVNFFLHLSLTLTTFLDIICKTSVNWSIISYFHQLQQ